MAWTTSGEEAAVSDAASRRARGDVLYDRDGAFADERDGHRVGADALARDAAGGVGGAGKEWPGPVLSVAACCRM